MCIEKTTWNAKQIYEKLPYLYPLAIEVNYHIVCRHPVKITVKALETRDILIDLLCVDMNDFSVVSIKIILFIRGMTFLYIFMLAS